MSNWKLDDNRSITYLLSHEENIYAVIMYKDDMERANISRNLFNKIGITNIKDRSLWDIQLYNGSIVRFVPMQRSQIEARGMTISLLLFPSSIEYEWKQKITRELRSNMIRSGGLVGTLRL